MTLHPKLPPFAFSGLSIVSTRSLNDESPNNSCKSSSFTVSYLIDSCGLSPESAISASKKVKLKTPNRPDSVLELFRNYGFDKTHISHLVRGCPHLLLYDPEKTLLPKLQYLHSVGFSKDDLATVFAYHPTMLTRSLENQIIPITRFLKNLLASDEKVVSFFKRTPYYFQMKFLVPNITTLRKLNVPASNIVLLAVHYPTVLLQKRDKFVEIVDKSKEMGFDPLKCTFVLAIRVLLGKSNKLIWDRCFEAYKKWGWSEEDILSAFKKHPLCMILSDMKIERTMGFFVNKMGYQSRVIAEMPAVLLFSLDKRIVPRWSVIQVLITKGLIKRPSLCSILTPSEKIFLERYVTRYEEESPPLS